MICLVMAKTLPPLLPRLARLLRGLGEHIRQARLRRAYSAETVAQGAGIAGKRSDWKAILLMLPPTMRWGASCRMRALANAHARRGGGRHRHESRPRYGGSACRPRVAGWAAPDGLAAPPGRRQGRGVLVRIRPGLARDLGRVCVRSRSGTGERAAVPAGRSRQLRCLPGFRARSLGTRADAAVRECARARRKAPGADVDRVGFPARRA